VIGLQRTPASGRRFALALLASSLIGCASHPDKIDAAYVSTLKYETYSCAQIALEIEAVERRTDDLYQALRRTRRADNWQAGVGILLLPTLFALEGGDGVEASEYAFLKGDYAALNLASQQKQCGMQSRSPDEQIEDSLTEDTLIDLPNNMRVSLSQMVGLLERAYEQRVITEEELNEALETAFMLLGSNAAELTPGALDSLYAIINKTDLGVLTQMAAQPPSRSQAPQGQPSYERMSQTEMALSAPMATPEARDMPLMQEPTARMETHSDALAADSSSDEQESIETILQGYAHLQNYYVADLPSWKLIRFFEKAGLPSNTPVLAFIDTSVWRSGKNGVLFAQDGLYYTNDFVAGAGGSYFISYADIATHAAPIYKKRYFYLGDDRLPKRGLIDFVGADTDLEELSNLILEIRDFYVLADQHLAEDPEPHFLFDTAY
jgi:hypothetical protein